jgi:hypothetical protein
MIAGGKEPFPVQGADGTMAIAAMLFPGIPLPPKAIATFPLDVAIQADDTHIPEVDHSLMTLEEIISILESRLDHN